VALDAVVLITDDERGISSAMGDRLRRLGKNPLVLRMGERMGAAGEDLYTTDLTDPAAISSLLDLLRRERGSVAGLIHLLPLRAGAPLEEMSFGDWRQRLRLEVKSLFHLAKAVSAHLKQAAEAGGGWLIAATAMGGSFASDGVWRSSFFPGQGGVAGLIKTLALEWPKVLCKVVDLDPEQSSSSLASQLLDEMAIRSDRPEVGYTGSRRLVIRPRPTSLDQDNSPGVTMDSSWVVLVTGGARGITAEVVGELARRYKPTLVVVGRAPLPSAEEPPDTAELTSPPALKAALMDRMRRAGQPFTPRQIEAAYTRLVHDREMRRSLTSMRQTGATVRYRQVDVRDAQGFGAVIDEIYQVHGRLDGVIHGAGIIEDKLIEDKTPDSFDRVFDTKVDSAFVLARHLRSDSLKFLVFFSSVAGCFGNRGQADYAAANEVLNKLAVYLDTQWPGRVVSINWGPWMKTGMASGEVQRQFAERGVQLISPVAGRRVFDEEIRLGQKGQVEVVIGDGPWKGYGAGQSASPVGALPLLRSAPLSLAAGGSVELIYPLDPVRDRYLDDHRLDGKPVFPVAMAMELMAEVAQKSWPERQVAEIRSLSVLRGIILDKGPKTLRVTARPQTHPVQERPELEVDVEIRELEQPGQICYRATLQLAGRLPEPPPYEFPPPSEMHEFSMSVDEAYRRWLFHGPQFQGISKIEGVDQHGIAGALIPSSPHECLAGDPVGQWLIDPIILDSSFQLAILWARAQHDMTPLPSRLRSYRRFGTLSGLPVRCYVHARAVAGGHTILFSSWYLNSAGGVMGVLEEMECPCSQALNRLAGAVTRIRQLA
jgi:NAD(P)-dependent dehydrogenase (short-subunit alcohol dehydrogenase family)